MTDAAESNDLKALLRSLRQLHVELSQKTVRDAVQLLSAEERKAFVTQRMELSKAILRLESAELGKIRRQIDQHSKALEQGVTTLTESLSDLELKAQWAQSLGNVLSLVAKVVPVG